MSRGPQSTHWCFTVHGHQAMLYELPEGVQYVVYQEELPPSNALHIQGYVQFERKVRGTTVTNLIKEWFDAAEGASVHSEPARGSDEDNEGYCTKEATRIPDGGGPYRYGVRVPHAGKKGGRSDLIAVQRKLDSGASLKRIAIEHFSDFAKYERAFRNYKRLMVEPRNARPEIYVHIGPSGCGKTRHCRETYPDAYWHPGGKWWDDYDGETTIVFDEFYGHKMAYSQLLAILDWGALRVETKGSSAQLAAYTFVFTSNQDPQDWYDKEKTHQMDWDTNPLKRRLDEFGTIIYWDGWRRPAPEPIIREDPAPWQRPPPLPCGYCQAGNCAFHHE